MNPSVCFSKVTALRVTGRCLRLLSDILMIGLCTYLTGGTDYEDIRLFALERGSKLQDMLSLSNGVPSEDTFEHVFQRINPVGLEYCLRSYGKSILSDPVEKQIVIKYNEIKAVPEVLSDIGIKDAGVSIDAMGTRREIADLILGKESHYMPAVKGNQKSLHEDIECAFKVNGGIESDTTIEKDHGGIETRKCNIH